MGALQTASSKPATFIEPATITRLLVVSYFIALSFGLIDGADIKRLATLFLSENHAQLTMSGTVLVLSVMILLGIFRKPAALVLAMIVFWPSYITLYAGGDVSAFWRDLALIGALVMTASEQEKALETTGNEVAEDNASEIVIITAKPVENAVSADDEAYREDFNLARSG